MGISGISMGMHFCLAFKLIDKKDFLYYNLFLKEINLAQDA